MFRTKFVQKIKTHISCSVTFSENRDVYDVIWKYIYIYIYIVQLSGAGAKKNIMWRMRFAC